MRDDADARSGRPEHDEELLAWHRYKKYPYLLAKFAFYGVIFALVYLCLRAVESVAFPLFLSMMLAYLLDPLIDRFEARKIDRTTAILIVIFGLFLAMVGFVAFLYPLVARQVSTVIEKFPSLLDSLQNEFLPWVQKTSGFELPPSLSEAVQEYGEEIKGAAPAVLKKVGDWGTGLLTQTGVVVTSLLNAVMIPIFTFYFLRDFDHMTAATREYIPRFRREAILARLEMMDEVIGAWFRGQIQVGLILALLYGVGLAISFKVTGHAAFDGLALGVISGILNIIPYVGFIVGFVLSVLVVLIEWTGIGSLVGVVIVFAIVQGLEGYVITPKIVGEKVGLSPVTVIIVLLLGGELGGLLGVLLAIPVAGAIKVILPDLEQLYRDSSYYKGHEPAFLSHMAAEAERHDPVPDVVFDDADAAPQTPAPEAPSEEPSEGAGDEEDAAPGEQNAEEQ